MTEIKVYKENEKLDEVFNILIDKIDELVKEYQLSYFELYGIIEAIKSSILKSELNEEEE